MAMRVRRVTMPETAKSGDIIEIRTVIQHPMVTGHTSAGTNAVPRRIIHTFTASYDGEEVFRAKLGSGIASNPLLVFTTVATKTGDIVFTWIDDTGERAVETRRLTVTAA